MPLRLAICGFCTHRRPHVYDLVIELQRAYRDELVIIELDCMAACDQAPAVMIDRDYYPAMSIYELRELIECRLASR